ncbi:MAG: hypothetical protein NW226_10400 [Microscillaceae bacterium]|nr:hypothetical protein [Microscillaceae bacterium]
MKLNTFSRTFAFLALCSCGESESQNISPDNPVVIPTEITESYTDRQDRGVLENSDINEASGLVVSVLNPNALWTHNDSGDDARVFLIGDSGQNLGVFYLENLTNRDWEDMALIQDPIKGTNYLYIAEIGDNNALHKSILVYRFPEPNVSAWNGQFHQDTIPEEDIEKFTLVYPDGARDAETLLLDVSGDMYVISKRDNPVGIYRANYPQSTSTNNELQKVGDIDLTFVVAGDAVLGDILLKTYDRVYLWRKTTENNTLENIFNHISPLRLPYTTEPQGESIAWQPDRGGYFTLSEAAGQQVHLYYYKKK